MKMTREKIEQAEKKLIEIHKSIYSDTQGIEEESHQYEYASENTFLNTILLGGHKTYKYILLTALLAKTTFGDEIDPLSLQEGDGSRKGSFDARSLGHKVIVPFEREMLNNALGGSNEPFLNKPARYEMISKDNPVRAGKDKEKLDLLVDHLSKIKQQDARELLEEALKILLTISRTNLSKYGTSEKLQDEMLKAKDLFLEITMKNFGGEILALCVGSLFKLCLSNEYIVKVHKVNQAGTSSNEVGDIDLFFEDKLIFSAEAKSKDFGINDVEHALGKAKQAQLDSFYFIYNHTTPDEITVRYAHEVAREKNILLNINSFEKLLPILLGMCNPSDLVNIPTVMLEIAKQMNMTDDALNHVKEKIEGIQSKGE